jgi:hypothetical protein
MTSTVRDVRGFADDLLFPDAMRVDGLDVLPAGHLDAGRARPVALFLLVFGSRPGIKNALLRRLGASNLR